VTEETVEQRDARMGWWRDAKFGMFIHWGPYAVPAGIRNGKEMAFPYSEWLMFMEKIPVAEYKAFAKDFNPVKYNAEEWVRLAKEAGMKYIVVTTKHHDGFAMFDTKASEWNLLQASPYGKDAIKDLADACRKQGMKLGFYYSQGQDWCNGGAVGLASEQGKLSDGTRWDSAMNRDMDDYLNQVAIPQVRELCSNYGEFPDILWWDTPRDVSLERGNRILEVVRKLKPKVIQNDRLSLKGWRTGDFKTPEQHIPDRGKPGEDWETCMTMNRAFGFKRGDNDWKSTETLLRNLIDVVSKGGNFLLNVGPTAEGVIPEPSVERLKEMGAWMKVNGEAIYGAGPSPFGAEAGSFDPVKKEKEGKPLFNPAWVWRCTTKPGKIYLHLFKWPTNRKFEIPAVKQKVTRAYLLADPARKSLAVTQTASGVSIALPAKAPDPIDSVVCLEVSTP
jgi:alpha-L-fucosidase